MFNNSTTKRKIQLTMIFTSVTNQVYQLLLPNLPFMSVIIIMISFTINSFNQGAIVGRLDVPKTSSHTQDEPLLVCC